MRTIYVVTEGSYSDYGILTTFERREDAEQFVADYKALGRYPDDPGIEAYDLHGEGETPHRVDFLLMRGIVERGELRDVSERSHAAWSYTHDIPGDIPEKRVKVTVDAAWSAHVKAVTAMGRDHAEVRKAFRDRVAKVRSEQLEPQPSR